MGILKLLAASLLALSTYFGASYLTADITQSLSTQAPATPGKPHQIPESVENIEKATQGMKEGSDILVNWAIVLFGGTIGIAILAKGAKIRDGTGGSSSSRRHGCCSTRRFYMAHGSEAA